MPSFRSLAAASAIAGAAFFVLLLRSPPGIGAYMDGPPAGYTGAFGEPGCDYCHAGQPVNDSIGTLELAGVPRYYEPGRTYDLTVSLSRAGLRRGGFQMSSRFESGGSAGYPAGAFVPSGERVRIVTGWEIEVPYIVQSYVGSQAEGSGTLSWTFEWAAPSAPGADVAFDLAANAANDDNSEFGDHIYTGRWRALSPQRPGWTLQFSGTESEFRGLSAADADVLWAGARNGVYSRTTDGGRTWSADTVPGAGGLFFIDAHAVDSRTAYLLGTSFDGGLAAIYKTVDGGESWAEQYRNESEGVFFDGMAFWDASSGLAFSDPVDGAFLIAVTHDGGATWKEVPPVNLPRPLEGEAGFAASGTAVAVVGSDSAWIGTGGGRVARVLRTIDGGRSWTAAETPLPGGSTAGIFGLAFSDPLHGIAVGGDYTKRLEASINVLRTEDGGLTWFEVGSSEPAGVRYGVAHLRAGNHSMFVGSGPSGFGYSLDGGATWVAIDTANVNTVAAAAGAFWVAGVEGRIGRRGSH